MCQKNEIKSRHFPHSIFSYQRIFGDQILKEDLCCQLKWAWFQLAVISLRLFHIIPFLPVGASEKFPPTSIAVDLFARGGCECMCCVLQREREQSITNIQLIYCQGKKLSASYERMGKLNFCHIHTCCCCFAIWNMALSLSRASSRLLIYTPVYVEADANFTYTLRLISACTPI